MLFSIFAQQTQVLQKGLDYEFVGLVIAILVALVTALVFATKRLSRFNRDNQESKRKTTDYLNQQVYQVGTAPLVLAVDIYLQEQVIGNFASDEQEIISQYEQRKHELLDPSVSSFIDLSNLPESVEYNQHVTNIVEAHTKTQQYDHDYQLLRRRLVRFYRSCWLPIAIVVTALGIHLLSYFLFNDTSRWQKAAEIALSIGLLTVIASGIFYYLYYKCDKKLDDYGAETSND